MNTPVREGETIEGSRTMRNRPYPVLKCSSIDLTLKSWLCSFLSAVVAADWLQLDGGMET